MNNFALTTVFIQKINNLIDSKKVNKSKLADHLEVGRTTLYGYLDGSHDIPLSLFLKICEYLEIDLELNELTGVDKAFNSLKKELISYIDDRLG